MKDGTPSVVRLNMQRGKRELVHHRPHIAMLNFRTALEKIPPERVDLIRETMYWLAVSLFRLDKTEHAIQALASAQRIGRRSSARRLYLTWVNGYGMMKRANPELDDLYAYSSFQIGAFLAHKRGRKFESMEERDIVMRIVLDAWKSLCGAGHLNGKSCSEKLELFKTWKPSFPAFSSRGGRWKSNSDGVRVLVGNFVSSACQDTDARCSCGSGLPYCMCCGRIPALRELSGNY